MLGWTGHERTAECLNPEGRQKLPTSAKRLHRAVIGFLTPHYNFPLLLLLIIFSSPFYYYHLPAYMLSTSTYEKLNPLTPPPFA
jgi:hypothetical protein